MPDTVNDPVGGVCHTADHRKEPFWEFAWLDVASLPPNMLAQRLVCLQCGQVAILMASRASFCNKGDKLARVQSNIHCVHVCSTCNSCFSSWAGTEGSAAV